MRMAVAGRGVVTSPRQWGGVSVRYIIWITNVLHSLQTFPCWEQRHRRLAKRWFTIIFDVNLVACLAAQRLSGWIRSFSSSKASDVRAVQRVLLPLNCQPNLGQVSLCTYQFPASLVKTTMLRALSSC